MNKHIVNPLNVPTSSLLGIFLTVIFLLYTFQIVKQLPCGDKLQNIFMSSFVHIDSAHLISNLYSLYALSRVEQQMGCIPFTWLIIFLTGFTTLVEFIIRKFIPTLKYSVGFSGVLFGIVTWEIVSQRNVDMEMILAIVLMVVTPNIKSSNISLFGHAIGAISGVFGGILWQMIHKEGNEKLN